MLKTNEIRLTPADLRMFADFERSSYDNLLSHQMFVISNEIILPNIICWLYKRFRCCVTSHLFVIFNFRRGSAPVVNNTKWLVENFSKNKIR